MRLRTRELPDWPPLAWLARCGPDSVELLHGPMVEAGDECVSEGAWAGLFTAGDLDRAPVVAGSGVRVREGEAVFVASTSTVDRLHSLRGDDEALVSNSLPALLAASGAELDRGRDYGPALMGSVIRGIRRCAHQVPSSGGPIGLHYFHNLVWDGRELAEREKPEASVGFADFEAYRAFLAESFAALAANMADPARRRRLAFLGTLSSGYDGNAATTLAAEAGCREALCFETTRRERPDSGVPVAEALGIEPVVLRQGAWREVPEREFLPEVPFLAVKHAGALVEFHAANERLEGKVLVTGFYGDSIWNRDWEHLGPDIRRKDASGLGFTEYRLRAGFAHCPPTFWAARQVAEVVGIARSPEMAPWVTGEEYQRPVARRIVEEAGVPRELFGRHKRVVAGRTLHRQREFLRPASGRDYAGWLRAHRAQLGLSLAATSPRLDRMRFGFRQAVLRLHTLSGAIPGLASTPVWRRRRLVLLDRRNRPTPFRRHRFWWALERAKAAYRRAAT